MLGKSIVGSLKDPDVAALFSAEDPDSRFADLREIGHGSFGAVYFGVDRSTKECIAIKRMSYAGKQSAEKWQDIIKEVRFLQQLNHRHIVQYKGCFLKEHTCWLIMEYCVGSAADIIEVHREPLREMEISMICYEVLQGLIYLHNLGRIHRDVKAGNILLAEPGVVKLGDFGSASIVSPAQSFVGTPYWMAPEVILAMDEGNYDSRADIWSLGITCIELGNCYARFQPGMATTRLMVRPLIVQYAIKRKANHCNKKEFAERRPPLFNMNAMSALYHIAQNEPPSLNHNGSWSANFYSFVDVCLAKDPTNRPTSHESVSHPFLSNYSQSGSGILIELVQRTKEAVVKLDNLQYRRMMKFFLHESVSAPMTETSSLDSEDVDSVDFDDRESGSSTTNSLASLDVMGGVSSVMGETGALPEAQQPAVHPPSANQRIRDLNARRAQFATIRTVKAVRKEIEEHQPDAYLQQITDYKRLRRQQQKEVKQLEEKQTLEMEQLRVRLDREYQQILKGFTKELEKLHSQHQQYLEQKARGQEDVERRSWKQMKEQQQGDTKALVGHQKKQLKQHRDRLKQEIKDSGGHKAEVERQCEEIARQHQMTQMSMQDEQEKGLNLHIRKVKKTHLLHYHKLEQDLLREELGVRCRQLDNAHQLLRRHADETQSLEKEHLTAVQGLRDQQLTRRHATELQNQHDYTRRLQDDLKRRHTTEMKQQPKDLKLKESAIRKQYRQALKTQHRQYKALKTQLQQASKARGDDVTELLTQLKQEKERKIAVLAEQYETSVTQMTETQTVKLDSRLEQEATQLREKLDSELEMLMAAQSRARMQLHSQHQREEAQLKEKLGLRRAVLEQKVEEELAAFDAERRKRLEELERRQQTELNQFDQETAQLGISNLSLVPGSRGSFIVKEPLQL